MNAMLGILQFGTMALAIFLAVGAILSALSYRLLSTWLEKLRPASRATLLTAWSGMPLAVALILTLATFSPSLLGLMGLAVDHCETHRFSHPHLCLLHPPVPVDNLLAWILKSLILGLTIAALASLCTNAAKSRNQIRALLACSRYNQALSFQQMPLYQIDTDRPVAFCAGLWVPHIFVSRGLMALLSADQLRAVLAHEQAHGKRRDTLRLLVAGALGIFHLPSARRRLLSDLALACEQACDEEAAQFTGDRLAVAETILVVARHGYMNVSPALAFVSHPTVARVQALLAPPQNATVSIVGLATTAALMLLLSLLLAEPLHHLTETLLGLLTR